MMARGLLSVARIGGGAGADARPGGGDGGDRGGPDRGAAGCTTVRGRGRRESGAFGGGPSNGRFCGPPCRSGVVLMLVSLNANLPRYAIERYLGTRRVGGVRSGGLLHDGGQHGGERFGPGGHAPAGARLQRRRPGPRFRRLCRSSARVVLALGAGRRAGCGSRGRRPILGLLYRPEYAACTAGCSVAVMAAALAGYVAEHFGYVITSARAFRVQMPLFGAVAATSRHCELAAGAALRAARRGSGAGRSRRGCRLAGEIWVLGRAIGRDGARALNGEFGKEISRARRLGCCCGCWSSPSHGRRASGCRAWAHLHGCWAWWRLPPGVAAAVRRRAFRPPNLVLALAAVLVVWSALPSSGAWTGTSPWCGWPRAWNWWRWSG